MSTPKVRREYHQTDLKYSIPEKEIVSQVNSNLPLNLKHISNWIDRIHQQYPIVSKTDIAIIVKTFFESIRELTVSGAQININKYISDVKILTSTKIHKGRKIYCVKFRSKLPKRLK